MAIPQSGYQGYLCRMSGVVNFETLIGPGIKVALTGEMKYYYSAIANNSVPS